MEELNSHTRLNRGLAATKRKRRRGLGFEALEHRRVLTTITVNTTADTNCVDVESSPTDANGQISLRSAVQYADNNQGPYTIDLPNDLGTYALTIGAMTLGNDAVNLDLNITIQGVTSTGAAANPASVVIEQTQQTRIFLSTYPPSGLNLTFNNLTLKDGQTPANNTEGGSCMYVGNGDNSVTTINNCIITGNVSSDAGPGAVALNNGGTLVVVDSTFTDNSTTGSGGFGAAIDFDNTNPDAEGNAPTGNLLIQSCTFIGNTAATVGGSAVEADNIVGDGDMNILDSSFIDNSVTSSVYNGGAVMETTGALNVSGCVFYGNTCSDGYTGVVQAADEGIGTITANNDWWGANDFPGVGSAETTYGDVSVTERLDLALVPTSSAIGTSGSTGLTAKVVYDTANGPGETAIGGTALDGTAVTFGAGGLAGTSVTPVSAVIGGNGIATSTLLAGVTPGITDPTVTLENTTATTTVSVDQAPQVTTQPSNTRVTVGQTATFTAQAATGFPAPSVQWMVSSNGGASFSNLTNGTVGGATYSGVNTDTLSIANTTVAMNNYQYEAVFSNTVGTATSNAATLMDNITISSGASTTFTEGVAGSFTITTGAGTPAGTTLGETGNLPSGVTFVDNGNGTATLSGTAAFYSAGTYDLVITAADGSIASTTQDFTLTVQPALSITSTGGSTFTVNTAGTFTITTQTLLGGEPTLTYTGTLPSGVSFDNNGDGTGTLSGTPASGAGGVYPITITASNGTAPDATQSFTLTVNEAPTITSSNGTTFTVGTAGTFTVLTAHDYPAATTLTESGTLPAGVTFVDNGSVSGVNDGNDTATLSGTPAAGSGGVYTVTITASNGTLPDATQTFTLTVNEAPNITSASSATFALATAGAFTVTTAHDYPAGTALTESGTLPSGVTFVDNGNGTAALSGTPAANANGAYPITITASNGIAPNATQSFTLNVDQETTFTVGAAGTLTVTAPYNLTDATSLTTTSSLPGGVTFVDNGDGTATLSGTPTAGSGGVYPLTVTASDGSSPDVTETVLLTVDEAPQINSVSSATFTVGTSGTFSVTTGPGFPAATFSETGSLPSGVTFVDNGNGTATLSGKPATGSGGSYPLTITAANGVSPEATQSFTLIVDEAPTITSANNASFYAGIGGTFTVTTAHDYPTGTTLSESGSLPAGVTFTDNGNGTATLAAAPAATASGSYDLVITAHNGVAPDATQNFTLTLSLSADLGVSLTSSSTTEIAGGNITYTVAVTNYGPTLAQHATLSLPLGAFSFVSQAQTAGPAFSLSSTANSVTDTIASLAANASATFSIVARLSPAAANGVTYSNTAIVSSSTHDPVPGNNSSSAGVAAVNAGALLKADPFNPALTDLVIGTSVSGKDDILVNPAAGGSVTVTKNGATVGTYHPTGRIVIYAGSGNDVLTVSAAITLPACLFAGSGTDVLQGGGGDDVLVGGSGRDALTGGSASNLIIGGSGLSREQAAGSSIMIGGTTSYDHNDAALAAIINEWGSTGIPLATRISNLRSGIGDDGVTLNTSTISLNQAADQLFDTGAVDWFWSVAGSKTGPNGPTGVLNPASGSVID
jgi:hypothetical protein